MYTECSGYLCDVLQCDYHILGLLHIHFLILPVYAKGYRWTHIKPTFDSRPALTLIVQVRFSDTRLDDFLAMFNQTILG
jgi:hypothetical protein